jgi:hypothetical protein
VQFGICDREDLICPVSSQQFGVLKMSTSHTPARLRLLAPVMLPMCTK